PTAARRNTLTNQELYQNYRRVAAEINAAVATSARQPRNGVVWITSIAPVPGRLTEAVIFDPKTSGHAARCIFEGTSRLSTETEISDHCADQDRRRLDRQSGAAAATTAQL